MAIFMPESGFTLQGEGKINVFKPLQAIVRRIESCVRKRPSTDEDFVTH